MYKELMKLTSHGWTLLEAIGIMKEAVAELLASRVKELEIEDELAKQYANMIEELEKIKKEKLKIGGKSWEK